MNVSMIASIIEGITGVIGTFLYGLFAIFFRLIDWLQSLFRALAGLAPIVIDGETVNANDNEAKFDIIFYLIQSDIVIDVFISMLVFMIVMLVLFTILALIRNVYQEKSKPPMEIVNKAFKALWTVFIVPVTLILGLMVGNIILQAVDEGTRVGGASKMSATLFIASAYDANRLRNGDDLNDLADNLYELVDKTNFLKCDGVNKILNAGQYSSAGAFSDLTEADYDTLARLLDNAIANGEVISNRTGKPLNYITGWRNDFTLSYALFDINYLVMGFGGGIILGIFIRICYGMVGRIFKCIFDVVLIPVVCAIMPLDDGKAVGSWKSDIIKNVTMAYSTVGIMNIYFAILPVINNIDFTGIVGAGILNTFTTLMLQIIGVATASSMIGTVNGWLGGLGMGNVLSEGDATKKALNDGWKQITDKVNLKKRIEGTAKFGGAFVGGYKQASKTKGKFGSFVQGAASAFATTERGKKFGEFAQTLPKAVADGKKAGKGSVDARATYDLFDSSSDAAERRKKRYELQLEADAFNKRYAKLKAQIAAEAPGSAKRKALEKRLKKSLAKESVVAAAVKGGALMPGSTQRIDSFEEDLEALRSDFEFEEKTKTALDDFSTDWESVLDSVETAKSILGRDRVRYNLQGFLDGTDKASFVAGLSQDQLEYAENLKSKWLSAQNKAYKTLKTMYKKDSSLFPAISSEEDIDKMSADVALEHLKSARVINNEQRSITLATVNLGTMLEDVTQNSRKLEREVGDKEKELTEAKAQIAVSLYDGSADSDLIDAANKGSK